MGNLEISVGVETGNAEPNHSWWVKRIHPDDLALSKLLPSDLQHSGTDSFESEYRVLHAGGHWITICDRRIIIRDLGGVPIRVIGSRYDTSAHRRAEAEIKRHMTELVKANEDLLYFAYGVGHDLQAPLRTVSAFCSMLASKYKGQLDQDADQFITWIVEASARTTMMLNDLMAYAQVAGSIEVPKPVSLDEALTIAIDNLRTSFTESSADVLRERLPNVTGSLGQFSQLFQNLLSNSLKYCRSGVRPQIEILSAQREDEWLISVRDNGVGFKQEYAECIFGVFERLHGHSTPGSGVGLAICKRIVEKQGGRIWATGTPGQGATFSFTVPIAVN